MAREWENVALEMKREIKWENYFSPRAKLFKLLYMRYRHTHSFSHAEQIIAIPENSFRALSSAHGFRVEFFLFGSVVVCNQLSNALCNHLQAVKLFLVQM